MVANAATATLERFVTAQAPLWPAILAELRAGAKRTHWMWFVFPQLAALGQSATARYYGITGLAEARAYLAHPLLGTRYGAAVAALWPHRARDAAAVLGAVDALKLRSSLTLFAAAGAGAEAEALLAAFFGTPDAETLRRL